MALAEESTEAPKRERWSFQWKELHEEVITSGLCTGCAGCVISCPHDVIGYDHVQGGFKPFHIEEELRMRQTTFYSAGHGLQRSLREYTKTSS